MAAASRASSSASTCSNTAACAMARVGSPQVPLKFVCKMSVPCAGVCVSQLSWCAGLIPVCRQCSTSGCRCKFDPQAAVMYKYCLQRQTLCSCDALAHHFYELMHLLCTSNNRCCSLARKRNFPTTDAVLWQGNQTSSTAMFGCVAQKLKTSCPIYLYIYIAIRKQNKTPLS